MGITVLTLGFASVTGFLIPDHLSGENVRVDMVGITPKSRRYPQGHPIYELVYSSGFRCGVWWQDGQAIPGYTLGVLPFVPRGRDGWHNQAHQSPSKCHKHTVESCNREFTEEETA